MHFNLLQLIHLHLYSLLLLAVHTVYMYLSTWYLTSFISPADCVLSLLCMYTFFLYLFFGFNLMLTPAQREIPYTSGTWWTKILILIVFCHLAVLFLLFSPTWESLPPGHCVCFLYLGYLESIHYRIHRWVGMWEENANVESDMRDKAALAVELNGVHDVYGQPAGCKQSQNKSQWTGQLLLFNVICAGLGGPDNTSSQLLRCCAEDEAIQNSHDHHGRKKAAEEDEVDQVGHWYGGQELAHNGGGVWRL